MSEVQKVRIGIVGAGGIVRQRHLPGLKKIAGVEIVAVANRSLESGRGVAVEWDIPEVVTDWRVLVARSDIDAVLIGTWPYMHCPVSLAALGAGKHVFCQARMAMNLAEARQMREAAEKSDRVAMVCPAPQGMKGDRVMRRLLAEGYVGQPRLVRLTSLGDSLADPQKPLHWRQDRRLSGNNVLTLGIYAEVMHRWLGCCGSLSATMRTFIAERPAAGGGGRVTVEMPDALLVAGEMESGAHLEAAMSGVVPHGPEDTLQIHGDGGALIYNFAEDTIAGRHWRGPWMEIAIGPEEEGAWTVEADFVEAIRTAAEVHPDFSDGYKYMEFIEAVWRSSEQGRRVDFPVMA